MTGMRSRKVLLGAAALAVLAIVAVVGVAVEQPVLAAAAALAMALAIGVLVLDAVTTLRRTERQLLKLTKLVRSADRAKPAPPTPGPGMSVGPVAGEADLIGTIRLLQAQYVGRLDRAQATLEAAVDRLPDGRGQ